MCLSVPAQVIAVNGLTCQALFSGNIITVGLHLVEDVAVGDYVLVHTGFALEKLSPQDAAETLRLIGELVDKYNEA